MIHPKVRGAMTGYGLGFSISVLGCFILRSYGVQIPDNVEYAGGSILTALWTFAGGWVTPAKEA